LLPIHGKRLEEESTGNFLEACILTLFLLEVKKTGMEKLSVNCIFDMSRQKWKTANKFLIIKIGK